MRAISIRETFLHVFIAINLMMSVTLTRGTIQVSAQTGCPPGTATGKSFPANTRLTVYLDSTFNDQQRQGIMQGFAGWTGANGATGNSSGIVVDHYVVGPPPNPLPVNSINVVAGTPTGGVRGETVLNPGGPTTGTTLVNAVVTIDPRVTSQSAMQEVSGHEGGHAIMGLGNSSSSVGLTESIMSPAPYCSSDAAVAGDPSCGGVANYNALRPLAAPTPCDQLAAKANGNYGNPNPPQPNPPSSSGTGTRPDESFWTGYNPQNRVCYQWFQVTVTYICTSSKGCTVLVDRSAVGSPMCY